MIAVVFAHKHRALSAVSALIALVTVLASRGFAQPQDRCKKWTTCLDFDDGVYDNVICNRDDESDDGHIELVRDPAPASSAWIPYVCLGIISKIDIQQGREVARYRISPAGAGHPRTAVDAEGNCYVALFPSSCQGRVVKILNSGGFDRNGNGQIDTSTGPGHVLQYGQDERIAWDVPVGSKSQIPRAIAIDPNGDIWVGLSNSLSRYYVVLDPATGAQKYGPVGVTRDPFGAIIDSSGFLWSAVYGWGVEKVDTAQRSWIAAYRSAYGVPNNAPGAWGLAEGSAGEIWLGGFPNEGVYRFRPGPEAWDYFRSPSQRGGCAVCVAPNGNVWVALGSGWSKNCVAKFDPSGNLLAIIRVHNIECNPIGIGTDGAGNIIVVNEDSACIDCFRESDGQKLWCLPTLPKPHVYSSFTGGGGNDKYRPLGSWTVLHDWGLEGAYLKLVNCSQDSACNSGCSDCESCEEALQSMSGQCVCLEYRCADTLQELQQKPWR